MDIQKALKQSKEQFTGSWDRLAHDISNIQGDPQQVSGSSLHRYATGATQPIIPVADYIETGLRRLGLFGNGVDDLDEIYAACSSFYGLSRGEKGASILFDSSGTILGVAGGFDTFLGWDVVSDRVSIFEISSYTSMNVIRQMMEREVDSAGNLSLISAEGHIVPCVGCVERLNNPAELYRLVFFRRSLNRGSSLPDELTSSLNAIQIPIVIIHNRITVFSNTAFIKIAGVAGRAGINMTALIDATEKQRSDAKEKIENREDNCDLVTFKFEDRHLRLAYTASSIDLAAYEIPEARLLIIYSIGGASQELKDFIKQADSSS